MSKNIVILGGGGHCGVLMTHLPPAFRVKGICDPAVTYSHHPDYRVPVWQKDDEITSRFPPGKILLVNAVGSASSMKARHDLYTQWKERGYRFAGIASKSAYISRNCKIGEGSQILARAVIETNSSTGVNCIINTMAQVDHDCRIGHSVHIAVGAILCGNVTVGNQTHVGAGAIVIQNIRIGSHCLIGAGAIVTHDVPDYSTVYPARSTVLTRPPA